MEGRLYTEGYLYGTEKNAITFYGTENDAVYDERASDNGGGLIHGRLPLWNGKGRSL